MGLVQSCNKALDNIDTSFFMRLDADDYLSLNALDKIEEELKYLEKEDFIIFQRWDVDNNKALSFKVTNDMYTWIAVSTVFNKDAVISVGDTVKNTGKNMIFISGSWREVLNIRFPQPYLLLQPWTWQHDGRLSKE